MDPRDYSNYHHPLTGMFEIPKTQKDWEKYRLTEEQVTFFKENGYVSGIKLLEDWQVDLLRNELADLMVPSHPLNHYFYEYHSNESKDRNAVLFHSLGHWRIARGYHDILWNPAFLMAAHQLLGNKNVRFWHDQLFCKPAKHGGVVAWHQDYSYWTRTVEMQHLTCWTALDDATAENGCLHYIPGSHRWGLLQKPELAGSMDSIMEFLDQDQKKQFQPIPIELQKGYSTFHHPLLLHGSYENKSERSRRAFVLNVFADGTRSNTSQPLLNGVPIIEKGKKIEGRFFPLLFDT